MKDAKTIELTFQRTIPALPAEVYDAWLNPEIPGAPWHEAEKVILDPKVDGLWHWLTSGHPHYGRFVEVARPDRLQLTWMSPSTLGEESIVTITFKQQGENTIMTLVHSGLPDTEGGRGHERGWNYFLGEFTEGFENRSSEKQKLLRA